MIDLKSQTTRNIDQYRAVHRFDAKYGRSSERFLGLLLKCVESGRRIDRQWKVEEVLDFGCGKSNLVVNFASEIGARSYKYDPAIPEYSSLQTNRADLVINTDVLEHLDDHEADLLLSDISNISRKVFFNIATKPAGKQLPNGENAHATVRSSEWWHKKLSTYFENVVLLPSDPGKATFITWRIDPATRGKLKLQWLIKNNAIRKGLSSVRSAWRQYTSAKRN